MTIEAIITRPVTWDTLERACLLLGLDADGVFFAAESDRVPALSLEDGERLLRLFGIESSEAMTPQVLMVYAESVSLELFSAVREAQQEAQRYRVTLEKRYPYLFKQRAGDDSGPPMRVALVKFAPSDYAEITQRWSLAQIYLWLLALKVQQFDESVKSAIRDFKMGMN